MAGGAVLRLLGLDVGASRIGAAISDPTGILVSPLAAVTPLEARRRLGCNRRPGT